MAIPLLFVPGDAFTYQDRSGIAALATTGPARLGPGDRGLLIEEATTNHNGNPSVETTNAGYSAINATYTREFFPISQGSYYQQLVVSAGSWLIYCTTTTTRPNVSAGQDWTFSVDVVAPAGKEFFLRFDWRDGIQPAGSNLSNSDSPTKVGTGTLTRYSFSAVAPVGATWFQASVRGSGALWAGTETVLLDAWQFEQKAYATSYCDGSKGTGYSWSGTAHGSPSSRLLTLHKIPELNHISPQNGTIAVRFQRNVQGTSFPTAVAAGGLTAGKDRVIVWVSDADDLVRGNVDKETTQQGLTSAVILPVDTLCTAFLDWAPLELGLTVNANARASAVKAAPVGDLDTSADITLGTTGSGSTTLNGIVHQVLIFDRALTAVERNALLTSPQWSFDILQPKRRNRLGLGMGLGI